MPSITIRQHQLRHTKNPLIVRCIWGQSLADFVKLQKTKADSENSWSIEMKDVDPKTIDLSAKNPNKGREIALRIPKEILKEMDRLDEESAEILTKIHLWN